MPNWCSNSITISGPKDKIKAIWEEATAEGDHKGLLEALVPAPENLFRGNLGAAEEAECKEKGIPNWYNWNINNWGTKWDVSTEGLEFIEDGDDAQITGWFDSAWSPPIEAYNNFLEENEDCSLEANYEEGGMDFAGIYDNGDDQGMDDITEWCRSVIKGTCDLKDTPELFQKLNEEFEFIEYRREWIEEDLEEEKDEEIAN